MYSGRAHSTRHHLTRTTPAVEAEAEDRAHPQAHDGHGAARLRHLHRDFELDDRFRRSED
jgi:hypothetical protein